MAINFDPVGLSTTQITQLISNQSGYALYQDDLDTLSVPQIIVEGATEVLTNNASISELTEGLLSNLWDSLGNKFTPLAVDDFYLWVLRFKAKNTALSGGYFDIGLDVGGILNTILEDTYTFSHGAGIEQSFNCMMVGKVDSTFLSNGGTPKIKSGKGNTTIYNKEFHVLRLHKK